MNKLFVTTILIFSSFMMKGQTELHFANLESLLDYAENNSYSIKNAEQKTLISKWQKISAQAGLVNFRMQSNVNIIDNLKLPVTYLPGEAFGGVTGSYKEVTTGQQYISNLSILPQIDLFNMSSWAKLKSTKVDSKLVEVSNLLAKKTLFESISASYYNVVSLNTQIETVTETLEIADSLLISIQRKYDQGLIRLQDLNDSKINKLTTQDKLQQLKKSLDQQLISLKILCDVPTGIDVKIDEKNDNQYAAYQNIKSTNYLKHTQSLLAIDKSVIEIDQNKYKQLPVLSFAFYDAWQKNSNESFFDGNSNWINSQYVGLKLSIPFPNVSAYSLTEMAKVNLKISEQNAEHMKLQNELENEKMTLDYEKAYLQLETSKQIKTLKEENYSLVLNQFNEDVLSTDKLLIAFNDMLISQLNYNIINANVLYAKSKIIINNSVK